MTKPFPLVDAFPDDREHAPTGAENGGDVDTIPSLTYTLRADGERGLDRIAASFHDLRAWRRDAAACGETLVAIPLRLAIAAPALVAQRDELVRQAAQRQLRVDEQVATLTNQRDELLEALKLTLASLRELKGLAWTGTRIPIERYPEYPRCQEADAAARAAVAKVKGQTKARR